MGIELSTYFVYYGALSPTCMLGPGPINQSTNFHHKPFPLSLVLNRRKFRYPISKRGRFTGQFLVRAGAHVVSQISFTGACFSLELWHIFGSRACSCEKSLRARVPLRSFADDDHHEKVPSFPT